MIQPRRVTLRGRVCWPLLALMAVIAAMVACEDPVQPLPVIAEVPGFALQNQHGADVSLRSLRGEVWVANFMFTSCPDICPLLTKKMGDLRLGLVRKSTGVKFVSFSVDPETDTPAVLQAYAKKRGADFGDWHFLTGPLDSIKAVVVQGFKQAVSPDPEREDNILHGSHFVLVDRVGAIRGFYRSDPDGLLALSRAATQLAVEMTAP